MCWIYVCWGNMRALLVSSSNIERLNIGKWIPSYQPPIRAETPPTSKSSRAFAIYCGILCKCKRTFKGPAYEKETTLKNYQKKMFVGLLLQKSCPSPIIRCLWKEFSKHFGIRWPFPKEHFSFAKVTHPLSSALSTLFSPNHNINISKMIELHPSVIQSLASHTTKSNTISLSLIRATSRAPISVLVTSHRIKAMFLHLR